jgi:hypothetical protein
MTYFLLCRCGCNSTRLILVVQNRLSAIAGAVLEAERPPLSQPCEVMILDFNRHAVRSVSTMADPLSIAASITGIIVAAVKITTVLSDLHDAPDHIADLSAEVNNIRIVFKAFQRLLDKPDSLPSRRAAMIQLEDVVVIVTEIVLVFSELETIVTPLTTRQRSPLRALTWVWQRSTTTRLVNQLQRHKSSLTVVLQIIAWLVVLQFSQDDAHRKQQF